MEQTDIKCPCCLKEQREKKFDMNKAEMRQIKGKDKKRERELRENFGSGHIAIRELNKLPVPNMVKYVLSSDFNITFPVKHRLECPQCHYQKMALAIDDNGDD